MPAMHSGPAGRRCPKFFGGRARLLVQKKTVNYYDHVTDLVIRDLVISVIPPRGTGFFPTGVGW